MRAEIGSSWWGLEVETAAHRQEKPPSIDVDLPGDAPASPALVLYDAHGREMRLRPADPTPPFAFGFQGGVPAR
jgi:hypothetical protein